MNKTRGYRIIGLAIFFSLLLSYAPVSNFITDFCIETATEISAFASVFNSDLDSLEDDPAAQITEDCFFAEAFTHFENSTYNRIINPPLFSHWQPPRLS